MKRLLALTFLAVLALPGISREEVPSKVEGPAFKVFQFPRDRIPRIDGDLTDWDMVPDSYIVCMDDMWDDSGKHEGPDKTSIDVKVKVGWVCGLDRLYFCLETRDDYWDFAQYGLHNDTFELVVDGDLSGGPHIARFRPDRTVSEEESYQTFQNVHAQNYHIFTPPTPGKDWCMVWGPQQWLKSFPWSNIAYSYNFSHGEGGTLRFEFYITPFDAALKSPSASVVSHLYEGKQIGLCWAIIDYDGGEQNNGFWNLSRYHKMYGQASMERLFELQPLEASLLKPSAAWSYYVVPGTREVRFNDESCGEFDSWHWDFGDGCTSDERNPVHTYAADGHEYTVTLTVSGKDGQSRCCKVWDVSVWENVRIDRHSVISRNNPHINAIDTLSPLSAGNGEFAVTVDVTGLQTWPELYSKGVPLCAMSQWGWHSFPNDKGYKFESCLDEKAYACQLPEPSRRAAADYFRSNPHRLNLGCVGFAGLKREEISDIDQTLDLWDGVIRSSFTYGGSVVKVLTGVNPVRDAMSVTVDSPETLPVQIRFPYPTGAHADDASDWNSDERHSTDILSSKGNVTVIRRTLDDTQYYVTIATDVPAEVSFTGTNSIELTPSVPVWSFTLAYSASDEGSLLPSASESLSATASWWHRYWESGGIVDFGACTDPRAAELERRVVLSQYLTAIQCAGSTPPQETGLTYNSWFGKFHLEMTWWHQAHFALWGHPEMLERTMPWFEKAAPSGRRIASRQGYEGLRWMKMTDPSGAEAPSNVGSYLIWQQPHYIYYAELLRRAGRDVSAYEDLVQQTAQWMASFVTYEPDADRYVLRGCIAAQETLKASKTVNPPFELSYWHFALQIAQQWRERRGLGRDAKWDEIIDKLSRLASRDGLYLAAESEPDTYSEERMYSDHMAVLAAFGVLPDSPQFDHGTMKNTLDWVMKNWNWPTTWGWDYPVTCMNAVRLGCPEEAVDALLMPVAKNTYLPCGHNWQSARLRCYLPGNGGLLAAVAMMCAGYDGCAENNPGFPKDGTWNVRWEGLKPMP